jgi:hypothetical protein
MATAEARIVTAYLDGKGGLTEVKDPNFEHFWKPDTNLDETLKEHYGWTLKNQMDKTTILGPVFADTVDVCTNKPDDPHHHNTLAGYRHEVVKLDCGYWGHYQRKDSDCKLDTGGPQRNFGLVQGHDVWLCNFRSNGAAPVSQSLPEADSPAGKLLKALKAKGLDINFMIHTVASATPFTSGLDDKTLHLFLPDLHLPERWPDPPEDTARCDKDIRSRLRSVLRDAQHQDGLIALNPLGEAYQLAVQSYLEAAAHGKTANFTIPASLFGSSHTCTPAQFAAEKDLLDRTIRSRSTWFYKPADGNSEEGDHEDKDDAATGDPAPAVDLAMLLSTVVALRDKQHLKIKVFQLGDLYELWMGREFLYRHFPVVDSFGVVSKALLAMEVIQAPIKGVNDELQYRMGKDWVDDSTVDEDIAQAIDNEVESLLNDKKPTHLAERYVYHKWSKFRLIHRHATGWRYYANGSLDQKLLDDDELTGELDRLRSLLAARGTAVEKFTLPIPATPNVDTLRACLSDANYDFKHYATPNRPGEALWNKLIFDLLHSCSFQNIHGNHDGYRSDPLFAGAIDNPAQEWISLPGIWMEHGHRWDDFNRDGVAFGAGMTNLVYYYNKKLIEMDRTDWILHAFPQEQKSVIPGAALWYSLVNIANNTYLDRTRKKKVEPFGIMVVGHTHSPDLVRIQYEND